MDFTTIPTVSLIINDKPYTFNQKTGDETRFIIIRYKGKNNIVYNSIPDTPKLVYSTILTAILVIGNKKYKFINKLGTYSNPNNVSIHFTDSNTNDSADLYPLDENNDPVPKVSPFSAGGSGSSGSSGSSGGSSGDIFSPYSLIMWLFIIIIVYCAYCFLMPKKSIDGRADYWGKSESFEY